MKRSILAIFGLLAFCTFGAMASDIPTLYITTVDSTDITSRDFWLKNSSLRIVMPDGTEVYNSQDISVKARGNSTFSKPKKPYAIRLSQASPLLGMTSNNQWTLLANFMDHSLLRNSLALAIAKQTSLNWTPDSRLVDVVVNGKLKGNYLLCEQIRIGKDWVDVDPVNGYLIEMDNYPNDKNRFETKYRHLPVNVTYPKEPSLQQMQAIEADMSAIEEFLYGKDSSKIAELYRKHIDIDSFVDWWLVHELTQNAEPNGPRSCYMYKGKDGLLKAGPVWDFDLAFISVGLDSGGDIRPSRLNRIDVVRLTGDCLYNPQALWYNRLLKDPTFRGRVKSRWNELEPRFKALSNQIDKWHTQIKESAEVDEKMWKGQDPARFDIYTTFESSVDNLKRVYLYRIERLNKLLNEM